MLQLPGSRPSNLPCSTSSTPDPVVIMDVSRLQLSIPSVHTSPETYGETSFYQLELIYGKLQWNVVHRFSEFLTLCADLSSQNYAALPDPPAKTTTRTQDPTFIEGRRIMLQIWIRAICSRPDLRTSPAFLNFTEFELHTGSSIRSVAPQLISYCVDEKFQLSDFQYCPNSDSLIVTYAEAPALARLGRIWSVIEQDQLGAVGIWALNRRCLPTVQESEVSYLERYNYCVTFQRLRCLFFHAATGRIFVGCDSGVVQIYTTAVSALGHAAEYSALARDKDLALHTECIMSLRGDPEGPGRFVTTGYDNAIRVVNCTTLETICGGKMSRRLNSGEKLSIGILGPVTDTADSYLQGRVFIGTSQGTVFIFSVGDNPPKFLTSFKCDGEITALELAGPSLLVAHKYALSIYRVGKDGDEKNATCIATLFSPLKSGPLSDVDTSGRTIWSIGISRTTPLLFLGHTHSISVWDCAKKACVSVIKCHSNRICRIEVLDNLSGENSVQILTGGTEGEIRLWSLARAHEYILWQPPPTESQASEGIPPQTPTDQQQVDSTVILKTSISPKRHLSTGCLYAPPIRAMPVSIPPTTTVSTPALSERKRFPTTLASQPLMFPPNSSITENEDEDDDCLMSAVSAVPHRH